MKKCSASVLFAMLALTINSAHATFDPQSMPIHQLSATTPVQSTASGLHYQVLQAGQGRHVTRHDEVEIRFISYDLNGEVQDGTLNNVPVIVPVSEMFTGLQEGLTLMQAGGIYELHIPAHLGYQEEGQRTKKAIRYRVEVLRINP